MPKWLPIPLAILAVALLAPRRGSAQQSRYFKVNGKCMVKPYDDLPAYEISCADWEREVAQESKGALGYEVKG